MGVTNLISDGSVLPKYASDLALTITESKTEVAKWNSSHTDVINLGFSTVTCQNIFSEEQ